jgi:hypothetical protein
MTLLFRLLAILGLALGLGGCSSVDARLAPGHSLASLKRFFVVTSASDNHGIDRHIATALQARGLTADTGPMTMMPDDTEAVISYQDRWGWDFSDYLSYLQIDVREPGKNEPFASVNFSATVPSGKNYQSTLQGLVDRLFTQQPSALAGDPRPKPDPGTVTKK